MDPSAACVTSRLQNFPFPTSQCPIVLACSQTSISPTSNVVDGHSNDAMVSLLWTSQHQNTRFKNRRLKTQPSGDSQKTIPPFSHTIGHSVHCLEQLYPNITRFTWNAIGRHSDKALLNGSPVLKTCCTSLNCNLCPSLHTDFKTVIKTSEVRICETLHDESGLGPASRWHAVVWLPDMFSGHMRNTCMWLKTSHDSRFAHEALCLHQNTCLHTWSSMAHSTPSLMIPQSLSTSSLQSALRPDHQRDLCRFHLLTRFKKCLSVHVPIHTLLQDTSPTSISRAIWPTLSSSSRFFQR